MVPIIDVERLSKLYQLGSFGSTTMREMVEGWTGRFRGRGPRSSKTTNGSAVVEQRRGPEAQSFWALKEVSFQVQHGEVLGIIGRNGAGKSTLLKLLSRITEPTSGRARLRGRVASLLEVGTGFHPELSGRENIFLNGAILGMKRAEIAAKFDEIVEFAEVAAFIDTPVKRYSSGMYVRLAFAVAAHLEPEILVLDEVLAVGDIDFQKKCVARMGAVAREGRTVLLVSHNIALIESLCDTALLLVDGAISAHGDAKSVVAKYLSNSKPADGGNLLAVLRGRRPSVAQFASIQVLDSEGVPATEVRMGEGLTISLGIRAERKIARPWIGITVRGAREQIIFYCANREAGFELPPLEGDCTVECQLAALNLLPGRYSLDLVLADMTRTTHDEVAGVAVFEVIEHDVFESGMPMTQQDGILFLKSAWTLRSNGQS
jgi:lipopolysaccharide transport system ATP-binding protein